MRSLALTAAVALVGLSGCDSTTPSSDTPDVISPVAFSIDVSDFPSDNARKASASGQNFRVAAGRVSVISGIVGLNLILPEAATRAATQVEPDRNEDGSLVYTNTVNVLGAPVEIQLTGEPNGGEVDWTLTTAEDGFERFTYYTATTTFNGRSGSWELFNPDRDGSVLRADFEVDATPEVTFEVPAGNDNAGARVRYETDGDMQLFDFTDADGVQTVVEWNTETLVGSIEASDFRGGDRVCWDTSFDDAACASV